MSMTKCLKCGGTDIEKGKMVSAGGCSFQSERHSFIIVENTNAYACMNCGYVEQFVDDIYREKIQEARNK